MQRKTRSIATRFLLASLVLALAAAGCEDEPSGPGEPIPIPGAKKAAKKKAKEDEQAAKSEAIVYRDEDFVESERNRDPFRSYLETFSSKAPEDHQRHVVMPNTSIEEMKLIAIISGTPRPRAMLVNARGVGYVVERGMYIGRPQLIQATGSISMTLNWRVDRIRENEVVLTRQDPVDPSRPPLTRVIPLHDEFSSLR